jgi:hypothetical protein
MSSLQLKGDRRADNFAWSIWDCPKALLFLTWLVTEYPFGQVVAAPVDPALGQQRLR